MAPFLPKKNGYNSIPRASKDFKIASSNDTEGNGEAWEVRLAK